MEFHGVWCTLFWLFLPVSQAWPAGCPLTRIIRPAYDYEVLPVDLTDRLSVEFSVKACSDVYLALSLDEDITTNTIEIALNPSASDRVEIRDGVEGTQLGQAAHKLSCIEFKRFWVAWDNTTENISLGHGAYDTGNQLVAVSQVLANYSQISIASQNGAILVWEQAPNGYLSSPDGVITSPNYTHDLYAPNLHCSWVIEADNSKQLELSYLYFDLEDRDSNDKCKDLLTISDSLLEILRSDCGQNLPDKLETAGGLLQITFTTDSEGEAEGFALHYKAIHVCGDNFTGSDGKITSPFYPDPYPTHSDCAMTIEVTSGFRVTLTFVDFLLDRKSGNGTCDHDSLSVYWGPLADEEKLLGRYCGDELPPAVTSPTHEMTLVLKSDHSGEFRGFAARYEEDGCSTNPFKFGDACDVECDCDATHTQSCDRISGECQCQEGWENTSCFRDVNECTQAENQGITLCPGEGRVCQNTPGSYQCICSPFTFEEVDGVCQALCVYELTDIEGTFSSPNFGIDNYPANRECLWTINVPEGFKIVLTFEEFHLEELSVFGFCSDYVQVFGVPPAFTGYIRLFCGQFETETMESITNGVQVFFHSGSDNTFPGFRASYYSIPDCNQEIFEDEGTISSPHHPDLYPSRSDCTWVIVVGSGFKATLTFTEFDLEKMGSSGSCDYDSVSVYDGRSTSDEFLLGRYCGSELPPTLTASEDTITVVFKSDAVQNFRGFRANFSTDGCADLFYGDDCSIGCDCNPDNTASCDDIDGACFCKAGWEGVSCDSDTDECAASTHNCSSVTEECENTFGGFLCYCGRGYMEDDETAVCTECPENLYDYDCSNTCTCDANNTASCDHVTGACSCKAGWEGATCSGDVDECFTGEYDCNVTYERCVNHRGRYSCECKHGYTKDSAGMCIDVDECRDATKHNCSQQCDNMEGGYTCSCYSGYISDGTGGCYEHETYSQYIMGFSAGIPAAVVVLSLIGCLIVCLVKRNRAADSSKESSPSNLQYENVNDYADLTGSRLNGRPATIYNGAGYYGNKAAGYMGP